MTQQIINLVFKDRKKNKKISREAYSNLAIIIGLFINIFLFIIKILSGILTGSIAIIGDGINSLSDCFSGIISLVGIKLSNMPSDDEHPFGHGRIEYLVSTVVSFFIIFIAISIFKQSVNKILYPERLTFNYLAVIILLFSVAGKFIQGKIYDDIGDIIGSPLLRANAKDSRSDVISTSGVLISLLIYKVLKVNLDGYVGIIVSFLIVKSGIDILRNTLDQIIGQAPSKKEVELITRFVESFEVIKGTHDLIVHDYGPGKIFATIHAEVDSSMDIVDCHDLINDIEELAIKRIGVQLTIHIDPLDINDERTNRKKEQAQKALDEIYQGLEIHDFRVVDGRKAINLVFDIDLSSEDKITSEELLEQMESKMKAINEKYHCIITIDRNYIRKIPKNKIK